MKNGTIKKLKQAQCVEKKHLEKTTRGRKIITTKKQTFEELLWFDFQSA